MTELPQLQELLVGLKTGTVHRYDSTTGRTACGADPVGWRPVFPRRVTCKRCLRTQEEGGISQARLTLS